jgi:hypothetical protein
MAGAMQTFASKICAHCYLRLVSSSARVEAITCSEVGCRTTDQLAARWSESQALSGEASSRANSSLQSSGELTWKTGTRSSFSGAMKTLLSLQTYLNSPVAWRMDLPMQKRLATRSRQSSCGSKRRSTLDDPFHNPKVVDFSTRNRYTRANFAFKLMRPGFGPPLKRLGRTVPARRHAGRSLLPPGLVAAAGAPRCRHHAGPAAQLNVER